LKNIKLEITPFESKTLKYVLERKFLVPLDGSQNQACSRVYKKLIFRLKQKGLVRERK